MNYFFITGDSSGIGRALKEFVLKTETNFVYGISRRTQEAQDRFQPVSLDLSNSKNIEGFKFPELSDADQIILVNNAGMLGPVKPLFEQHIQEIEKVYNLNTIAPAQLSAKFIQTYKNQNVIIINISSGAANSIIQGWSTYCSSKAALNMLTSTLIEDLRFRNIENAKVFSVSPGVIDTPMQEEIRGSEKTNFALHQQFSNLKTNSELINPETTAELIYKIVDQPGFFRDPFINLREYYT